MEIEKITENNIGKAEKDYLNHLEMIQGAILQQKDGITVARIYSGEHFYILKYFEKEEHRREIANYRRLNSLGIPTIRVLDSTESSLVMEDLENHPVYRLAREEDMADPQVARCLARWYRQLHDRGYDHVQLHGDRMYDESDFFTLENMATIKTQTETAEATAWKLLEDNFTAIQKLLCQTRRTLTYNDFYYTNMVVAKDKSEAFMFDYNLLGKGYIYSDLSNVTYSLSKEAGKVFLEEYGEYDTREQALHDVVSVVVSLYMACQREGFPWWAQEMVEELDTFYLDKIKILLQRI